MSVINTVEPGSGLRLQLDMPRSGALDPCLLTDVPEGVAVEDMRAVDAAEIERSYAVYSAHVVEEEQTALAGIIRQLPRYYSPTAFDERKIFCSELGTLWVNPAYRRRGVARTLVNFAAHAMDMGSVMPVAVCNENGTDVFAQAGFEPVGTMPSESDGSLRTVQVFPPHLNWYLSEKWTEGLREEFVATLRTIPRFSQMQTMVTML